MDKTQTTRNTDQEETIRFSEILGNEQIIRQLQLSIVQDRVNHAYIIQGAPGSGKSMLAQAFASALVCERIVPGKSLPDEADSCGTCKSCIQAAAGTNPDIVYVEHEKETVISIDEIRKQLVADIQIRPYNGGRKIYIVDDAQLMNANAQNALLKTLEEPPSYGVILLLTVNAQMLLPTIRSRCVMLELRPLTEQMVTGYLMEQLGVPDYEARLVSSLSGGSIGRAAQLAHSGDFAKIRDLAVRIAENVSQMDETEIARTAGELAEYKSMADDFLEILTFWYRDVLYFKASSDVDRLVLKDHLHHIRALAMRTSYENLENAIQAIARTKAKLDARVSFGLTMEMLLMTLKEI